MIIALCLSLFMGKKEMTFKWDKVVKKEKYKKYRLDSILYFFFGILPLLIGITGGRRKQNINGEFKNGLLRGV